MTSNPTRKRVQRKSTNQWVRLGDMRVYFEVQRALRPGWVAAHVPRFDLDGIGQLVLNHRADGTYSVLDGQHRVELLRASGFDESQQVECEVFEGLSVAEEAQIFLERNDKVSVRPLDKFRIRVTGEDLVAVHITKIVESHGLVITGTTADNAVRAVSSLDRVFGAGEAGPDALDRTIGILVGAWGFATANFEGNLVQGVGLVCLRYGDRLNEKRLAWKLAGVTGGAPGVLGHGKTIHEIRRKPIPQSVASVVVDIYNRGTRGKGLEDWWS